MKEERVMKNPQLFCCHIGGMTFLSLRIRRKGLCPHAKEANEAHGNTALLTLSAIYIGVTLNFLILARFEKKNTADQQSFIFTQR